MLFILEISGKFSPWQTRKWNILLLRNKTIHEFLKRMLEVILVLESTINDFLLLKKKLIIHVKEFFCTVISNAL